MLDVNMYKTEGKACYSYVYRWFIICLWSYTWDWFKSTYSFLSIWPSFYISLHLSIHSIPFRVTKSLHSQSLIRLHSLSADNTAALPGCQKHWPTPLLFNYLFDKSHPSSLLKLKSSCLISKQSRVGRCVCVFVCANCVDEVTLPSCNFRVFSTLKCFFPFLVTVIMVQTILHMHSEETVVITALTDKKGATLKPPDGHFCLHVKIFIVHPYPHWALQSLIKL